jgi:hypothetical protein
VTRPRTDDDEPFGPYVEAPCPVPVRIGAELLPGHVGGWRGSRVRQASEVDGQPSPVAAGRGRQASLTLVLTPALRAGTLERTCI